MAGVNPSMRLKVKKDTFFIPDETGSVYFRNNQGSFRMEGRTIGQWIEKLIPALDGTMTLHDLTDGLPDQHRHQVFDIAEVLHKNGYLKDVSQDRAHQLPAEVVERYAAQIEFVDNFIDSGAHRFELYRQTRVLVVGSGCMLTSVVAALFDSGLPTINVVVTDSVPTHKSRLIELMEHARKTDPDATLVEVPLTPQATSAWRDVVHPFDWILYVCQEGGVDELRTLNAICKSQKKVLLPAVCVNGVGIAGPLVHPDAEGCFESAWRRVHQVVFDNDLKCHTFSSTAGAVLANVLVFELFKTVTGMTNFKLSQRFYMLNLETLEGGWTGYLPHPLVSGSSRAQRVEDVDQLTAQRSTSPATNSLLPYLALLTSVKSGIFHTWEEGDLLQLPLAQCRVQVADPLSDGPSLLLPDIVCAGLTHEEARREAGLAGIEAYVSRLAGDMAPSFSSLSSAEAFVGVGTGQTVVEGVSRALTQCLTVFVKQQVVEEPRAEKVCLRAVEDQHCQFYLQALTTLQGTPVVGLSREAACFPVVWVGAGTRWFGAVGLNVTLALRQALQQALMVAQNESHSADVWEVPSIHWLENDSADLVVPACLDVAEPEVLQSALFMLKQNHKRIAVVDLTVEPFLKEELAGVFGVLLREEGCS